MLMRFITLSQMLTLAVSNSHVTKEQDGYHCTLVVKNGCGNDETCSNEKGKPQVCTDILDRDSQAQSGSYMIDPNDGGDAIRVYCDMVTDGGGRTVFQRREYGTTDFFRGWEAYKSGFGNVNSEHWLGNDNIYRITSAGHFELRIDMTTFEGESVYARYDNFRIGDESTNYKVIVGTYSGDAGKPRDCTEVLDRDSQAQSGEYTIDPHDGGKPIRVYCDMVTDGGGWTVFQRREDGTTDFYRGWAAYKSGFGNVNSEHWLGNDNIYHITSAGHFEMRVDMTSFDGESAYARYENFRLGDESTNYKLVIGTYSGDAGNSLSGHGNKPFSTSDQDNDENESSSCAVTYKGAWWYTSCHSSNLNGLYLEGETEQFATGVVWKTWKTYYYSLKTTEMKIRRLL